MKYLILLFFVFLSSCASYVQSLHRQIDNEQRAKMAQRMKNNNNTGDARPIHNPTTLGNYPSANNSKQFNPQNAARYNSKGTRRYKASDLIDNESDGSLWSGDNSESFLFVTNNLKRKGDIAIVEVMDTLKDKIQQELKRNFPEPVKSKKGKKEEPKEESKPSEVAKTSPNNANTVHDKISATVIEQVNKDYLLIRGRKEVMFRKFKRYFEFQALVAQKDITAQDTVSSDKLLETKINVLRY